MKIEDIDEAKKLKDKIRELSIILKGDNICNIGIDYYTPAGNRKNYMITDSSSIELIKQELIKQKNKLENRLNELL